MVFDYAAQGLGLLACGLIVSSYFFKSDKTFKCFLMAGNLVFASHFFMLGAIAGVAINIINFARIGLSIKCHNSISIMAVFMGIYVLAGTIIYQQPYDVLPVIAGIISTFAMFKLSGIKMRCCMYLVSLSWISYGIIFKSIGIIITEIFNQTVNTVTIFRLSKAPRHEAQI
jgi:hypothetical protein